MTGSEAADADADGAAPTSDPDGDGGGPDRAGEREGTKRNANVSATVDEPTAAAEEDGQEWRFDPDEVGEAAEPQGRPEPEPGSPSIENVAFVLLGVTAALAVIAVVLF
jgi:hypothetical protein